VARARFPWVARWCPTSTAPTADDRTAPAQTPARRPSPRDPPTGLCPSTPRPGRGKAPARWPAAPATARAAPPPWNGCQRLSRGSGSRPPRSAPPARFERTGLAPRGRRSPGNTTTTPHPGSPRRGKPPGSPRSPAPTPPPGRRGPHRGAPARPGPAYQVTQPGAGDLALEPVLPGEHHCHVAVTPPRARAEYVLGIVQRGARKPLGARHALHAEHCGRGLMEPHPDELRHRRPEPGQIADRPGVQCRVIPVRDGHTAPVPHVPCELRDSAGRGMLRIWPPQHLRDKGRHRHTPSGRHAFGVPLKLAPGSALLAFQCAPRRQGCGIGNLTAADRGW
jgi:hypothetical protein